MKTVDILGLMTAFVYYGDHLFDKIPSIFAKITGQNLVKATNHLNLKLIELFGRDISNWVVENWRKINESTFRLC